MLPPRYPSDLSDEEWQILEPLLSSTERRGRPPRWSSRRVADAVFYLLRSGCSWRMLPREYPPWNGYQVLKKWLSYREQRLLGQALASDEERDFTKIVSRIAAVILLGPQLDENYRTVASTARPLTPSRNS